MNLEAEHFLGSEYALGTMTFGEERGWGTPKEESQRIFDAFREAGGNFIADEAGDVAWNYESVTIKLL